MSALAVKSVYLGDTSDIAVSLTDPITGAAFNPTGSTLIFSIKRNATDSDANAKVQKISSVGGFTTVDAAAGLVTVTLVPSDRSALVGGSTYQCDVQAQNATTGAVKTVARFVLNVIQDVTVGTTISISTTTTNPSSGFTYAGLPDKPSSFTATVTPSVTTTVAGGANVTLTLDAGARSLFAKVTASGSGTAIVILSATNATDGAFIGLRLVMPASGLTVQVRDGTAGGTLLASVVGDGTAGTVGLLLSHGASAWDEPTHAAWLD